MKEQFHPKVSIVIPVYNGSNYLREAIDSALAQTYDNFEVIVVNDGSTDNGKTEKICKSYGDKIRYFKKENGGVASALNRGIKEMKGKYFSWLSHDDIYYPDKLEKQVNFLSKLDDKKTIIYSNVQYINADGSLKNKTQYQDKHDIKCLNTKLYPALKGLLNGCVLLIHKSILEESGGFNENLKTASDYDLWFKITRKYNIKFQKEVLIKYRIHHEQGTKTAKPYFNEANQLWSNILKDLKKVEIKRFNISLFDFYFSMYLQMKRVRYLETAKVAYDLTKKYYSREEISDKLQQYPKQKELIDSLLESTSWKITKPLRSASKAYKKMKRCLQKICEP
jgi:hypothetical protein